MTPFEALEKHGLLLQADAALPSVTRLVAGGPIKGSWWSHPKGKAIFHACSVLADHPDVLMTRLVDGKVTFVHRRLWPALLAMAHGADGTGISTAARVLLARVRKGGRVVATGEAALELEKRLLVLGSQEHTASGKHVRVLESWRRWAKRTGTGPGEAATLDAAIRALRL